jgi:mannose-6-phosphate isomerase-like protein (cupin superfamily)
MRRDSLRFGRGFRISIGNGRAQATPMVIPPCGPEGGADNHQPGADRWLFVVPGLGQAIVNGRRYPWRAGSLILIERGDRHEIRCTGRADLKTVSIYLPPAYSQNGKELARARARGRP